jgi:dTMP kinase
MRFIVIDGLDGVGKDTHAYIIKKRYEKKGEKVLIRSHPTNDNYFGKKAKKALLGSGKFNKIKASIFYMLDVLRSIRKYYRKGKCDTLIMVRYLIGTAYLPKKLVNLGYNFFYHFVPTSDYMLFLDASPDVLLNRVKRRNQKEIFETYDALIKVRGKSIQLARDWIIIDTSGSIESTTSLINKKLDYLDKIYNSS